MKKVVIETIPVKTPVNGGALSLSHNQSVAVKSGIKCGPTAVE